MTAEAVIDPVHSKAMPDLLSKLLAERQQVLVLFNHLAQLKPYTDATPIPSLLRRFCQLLVDYLALGHFEVYQCIEETAGDAEHCRRVRRLARKLYPRIAETTRIAVAFIDRYDSGESHKVFNNLDQDLSRLGERLADRLELEDRLIMAMKTS